MTSLSTKLVFKHLDRRSSVSLFWVSLNESSNKIFCKNPGAKFFNMGVFKILFILLIIIFFHLIYCKLQKYFNI